jgi:hypothetical protein
MGREAVARAEIGGAVGDVRALLESTELILRGDIRRRFPRDRLVNVHVEGEALCFTCDGEAVLLHMGALAAETWSRAIVAPPPSLRAKLGLKQDARVFLVGACDDAALTDAVEGALTDDVADAAMIIARIEGPDDLTAARAAQARCPELPIWAIYPKGKDVRYGDGAIRAALHEAGFRDSKSCAVSERLTATRYNPRRS